MQPPPGFTIVSLRNQHLATLHTLRQFRVEIKDFICILLNHLPGFGQFQSAADPLKKRCTDGLFQLFQLAADGL